MRTVAVDRRSTWPAPTPSWAGPRSKLIDTRRDRTDVLDLVSRLPDDQRDALLLRYAAGLTAKEIGVVLGKREDAIQKQIERGLAALRKAVDDHA